MVTRLLVGLCEYSPLLRRVLWRWWYDKLAREIQSEQWVFMNYGYQPPAGTPRLELGSADEHDRFCIQLYDRVVANVSLHGAKVLEIGSGRGGGASYLARYRQPFSVSGIDLSKEAVAFSRSRNRGVRNLAFDLGDAENLALPAESFDVVINVESSHCYGNFKKFVGEVTRVLKPGGHFGFADLRSSAEMVEVRELFRDDRLLQVLEEEDVTGGIAAALELDDRRKRAMIDTLVPRAIRPLFNEFAGLSGGQVFEGLRSGALVYHRFLIRKTDETGNLKR